MRRVIELGVLVTTLKLFCQILLTLVLLRSAHGLISDHTCAKEGAGLLLRGSKTMNWSLLLLHLHLLLHNHLGLFISIERVTGSGHDPNIGALYCSLSKLIIRRRSKLLTCYLHWAGLSNGLVVEVIQILTGWILSGVRIWYVSYSSCALSKYYALCILF